MVPRIVISNMFNRLLVFQNQTIKYNRIITLSTYVAMSVKHQISDLSVTASCPSAATKHIYIM